MDNVAHSYSRRAAISRPPVSEETEMTTALATKQQPQPMTIEVWNLISALAPAAHASRLFGVNSPEQAMMIMAKGHELGMPITAAFELIQVIQGKPTLSPRGALALVMASGLLENMEIKDGKDACTITMKRKGGPGYTLTWTLEDAKRAGIVKPDSAWQSYQANMLRWRAMGFVIDVLFSDVTGGLKRADEFGAIVSEEGNIIDMEATDDRA